MRAEREKQEEKRPEDEADDDDDSDDVGLKDHISRCYSSGPDVRFSGVRVLAASGSRNR